MPGGIRIDLEVLGELEVIGGLQKLRAKRDRLLMCTLEIVDPDVEMHLLRRTVGPLGPNMVRGQLDASRHSPSTKMLCQSSSAATVPPSSPAQKPLSAARSAASSTTIVRETFMIAILYQIACLQKPGSRSA